MSASLPGLALASMILAGLPLPARSADCAGLVAQPSSVVSTGRPLQVDDLLRLRDIGPVDNTDSTAPILALSPDATKVAFQIRQAVPASNGYCLAMVVLDLAAGARPVVVDSGGEYLRVRADYLGVANVQTGYTMVITPKWSPDGTRIAFLRGDSGKVQVWVANADGTGSRALSQSAFDVEDFSWDSDGKGLTVVGRPGLADAQEAIESEKASGYLFDDRFVPIIGNHPFPLAKIPRQSFKLDMQTGILSPMPSDTAGGGPEKLGLPRSVRASVVNKNGDMAWTSLSDPANVISADEVHVTKADGTIVTCKDERCDRARSLWWTNEGTILFQRREGWGRSRTGLYEWNPQTGAVRTILQTEDALLGCVYGEGKFVCGYETSVQPRVIAKIDLRTGAINTIFDPNPEFKSLRLGSVERLYWRNCFGIETFGDLVLPADHLPGQKLPLIIVQYYSHGFLRGGMDDEYPIQVFAALGFAVLSYNTPLAPGYIRGGSSWDEIIKYDRTDWREFRGALSGIENGVQLLVDRGLVDRDRVGITGLSFGAATVQYAVLNSKLFKAAAVSGCCEEETGLMTLLGKQGAANYHNVGFPRLTETPAWNLWRDYSIRDNAARMKTPLLLQVSDDEYLAALESVDAVIEQNGPIEMYVFADEHHEKWQPSHRRAIYDRDIDWFEFWLNGVKDPSPAKTGQYQRWDEMKSNLKPKSSLLSPGN